MALHRVGGSRLEGPQYILPNSSLNMLVNKMKILCSPVLSGSPHKFTSTNSEVLEVPARWLQHVATAPLRTEAARDAAVQSPGNSRRLHVELNL